MISRETANLHIDGTCAGLLSHETPLLCHARLTFALCGEQTEIERFFRRKGGTEQDLVRKLVGEPEVIIASSVDTASLDEWRYAVILRRSCSSYVHSSSRAGRTF